MDFNQLQQKVKQIHNQFPRQFDKKTQIINLVEEVGELANAALVDAGDKPEKRRRAYIQDAFADLFFALIVTATEFNIDLEAVLIKALEEINQRQSQGEYEDK